MARGVAASAEALNGSQRAGFIVMDFLELGAASPTIWSSWALALRSYMPRSTRAKALDSMDGCCGANSQPNTQIPAESSISRPLAQYRLPQLSVAKMRYPEDRALQELGAQLSARLDELFSMIVVEDIKPSLLHGDLWSGNYAATVDGTPCIFDCACYYGHYEADHGINNMFGGGEAFSNSGYTSVIPREPGWERRTALYELHHHLNHYNIL